MGLPDCTALISVCTQIGSRFQENGFLGHVFCRIDVYLLKRPVEIGCVDVNSLLTWVGGWGYFVFYESNFKCRYFLTTQYLFKKNKVNRSVVHGHLADNHSHDLQSTHLAQVS